MAQYEFVAWLARWLFEQENFVFEWARGNSMKSVNKHGVSTETAEQVFRNKEVLAPLGIQVSPQANEPRFGRWRSRHGLARSQTLGLLYDP